MILLEQVKKKIAALHTCPAAYILAHAAWSACDHRDVPGPSALTISSRLDSNNINLLSQLQQITTREDYSNSDQAEMLRWLHSRVLQQICSQANQNHCEKISGLGIKI